MTLDQLHRIRYEAAIAANDTDALSHGLIDGLCMIDNLAGDTLTLDDIGFLLAGIELGDEDIVKEPMYERALTAALNELLWWRKADEQAAAMATPEEMRKLSSASPTLTLVQGGHSS